MFRTHVSYFPTIQNIAIFRAYVGKNKALKRGRTDSKRNILKIKQHKKVRKTCVTGDINFSFM